MINTPSVLPAHPDRGSLEMLGAASICTLEVVQLCTDGGIQPRVRLDEFVIAEFAQALREGAVFPPVIAFAESIPSPLLAPNGCEDVINAEEIVESRVVGTDFFGLEDKSQAQINTANSTTNQRYWLADGYHRLKAHQLINRGVITVQLWPGTRRDAILYAVGANSTHGLRRSNEDKRKAVLILLADQQWRQWSNREIARRCAVHHDLVNRLRNEKYPSKVIPLYERALTQSIPIPDPINGRSDVSAMTATHPDDAYNNNKVALAVVTPPELSLVPTLAQELQEALPVLGLPVEVETEVDEARRLSGGFSQIDTQPSSNLGQTQPGHYSVSPRYKQQEGIEAKSEGVEGIEPTPGEDGFSATRLARRNGKVYAINTKNIGNSSPLPLLTYSVTPPTLEPAKECDHEELELVEGPGQPQAASTPLQEPGQEPAPTPTVVEDDWYEMVRDNRLLDNSQNRQTLIGLDPSRRLAVARKLADGRATTLNQALREVRIEEATQREQASLVTLSNLTHPVATSPEFYKHSPSGFDNFTSTSTPHNDVQPIFPVVAPAPAPSSVFADKPWHITHEQNVVGSCATLIADPPYGILEEEWEPRSEAELKTFTQEWAGRWAKGCQADTFVIFWSHQYLWQGRGWFDESLAEGGYKFGQLLMWHYSNGVKPVNGRGRFKTTFDPIFLYQRHRPASPASPSHSQIPQTIDGVHLPDLATRPGENKSEGKGEQTLTIVDDSATSPARQIGINEVDWGKGLNSFDCHVAAIPQSNYTGADLKRHPAQKPVSVYRWLIANLTRPGELVVDPFCGTAPSGIAAVELGRRFYGIEINPTYREWANGRIASYSGYVPTATVTATANPAAAPAPVLTLPS